jgi:uncharacterized protein (DUF427 family)
MARASQQGQVRVERSHKRIRALLAGEVVVDSVRPLLVWEVPYYPAYYLPLADVRAELVATGRTEHSPDRGDAEVLDVKVGRATAPAAARAYRSEAVEPLRHTVRLEWDAMDEWLEEDEPVYTHPRDPHTRVDVLASSRHVQVVVDGVTVAESSQPRILFETGLPPRYYLPLPDVRTDLLRPSPTVSHCPYKGTATYWTLEVAGRTYEDLVWTYRTPLPESQKIAGLLCFFTEKVALVVDGEVQQVG